VLLSPAEREQASIFPQVLKSAKSKTDAIHDIEEAGITVDYIEEINGRRFGAVYLGKVRLIDNVKLK
ncbi:MAG: hypothetical protein OEU76_06030, partial [Cyclobacteriaceae bacterium]|nr:hypothetical protein [Cyclobacteriaceae bacterium]